MNDEGRTDPRPVPEDDALTPEQTAVQLAWLLYGPEMSRRRAAEIHEIMCQVARESDRPTARRHGLFVQMAYSTLLADRDEAGLPEHEAAATHDWDAMWAEAGRAAADAG